MSIFDSLQNLLGGVVDATQGSVGDIIEGVADPQILQDLQDHAATITDGASEAVASATESATAVTEQGQATLDDITQNLGR